MPNHDPVGVSGTPTNHHYRGRPLHFRGIWPVLDDENFTHEQLLAEARADLAAVAESVAVVITSEPKLYFRFGRQLGRWIDADTQYVVADAWAQPLPAHQAQAIRDRQLAAAGVGT